MGDKKAVLKGDHHGSFSGKRSSPGLGSSAAAAGSAPGSGAGSGSSEPSSMPVLRRHNTLESPRLALGHVGPLTVVDNTLLDGTSFIPRVADDDLLFADDALLLQLFLDTLLNHHGPEIARKVRTCYSLGGMYSKSCSNEDLVRLETFMDQFCPGDAILTASAFSHMLNLENIAEEVQMSLRRRSQVKTGNISDEGSALTESTFPETLQKLLEFGKTPEEIFAALKSQTVDLVLTAHPTQSIRRTLLTKFCKIKRNLLRLHETPNLMPNDLKEMVEEIQREIQSAWRTDEIRRIPPKPQDEMRSGMSYFHETIWEGVPRFLRRVDTALQAIGIQERLPYDRPILQFSSWMGGDRDGNPRVTASVTWDVCLVARLMAANLYYNQIEPLMFELSMWRCNSELKALANQIVEESMKKESVKHYREFWSSSPPSEPYRVLLGAIRDKLFHTRERMMNLLEMGYSSIPEADTFTSAEQLMEMLRVCYDSLCSVGDKNIADGGLLNFMRQVACFGLVIVKLDIRQESERHTDVLQAITSHLGLGSYREWPEEKRQEFLLKELQGKRPLFGPDLTASPDVREILDTCQIVSELPSDSFGAYVISMSTAASDVLAVYLIQRECGVKKPLRVVPLFERLKDLVNAPKIMDRLFSIDWYREMINGRQEVMIGYSDSGKDAGRLAAAWALFQAQQEVVATAKKYNVKVTLFHGRGGTVGRGGGPVHLGILSQPPGTIQGSLRLTVQGEIIEHAFGEERLCFRSLERYTSATLEASMCPPRAPRPEWVALMQEMSDISRDEFRRIIEDKQFVPYFQAVTPVLQFGKMNIGSRPSKRTTMNDVQSLRAIPWVFAWTQTKLHLPVWLGIGTALRHVMEQKPENLQKLQQMHSEWPFFRATLDLIEMILAKADPRIFAMYDSLLAPKELSQFGHELRYKFQDMKELLLKVAGHKSFLENNTALRQRLILREPLMTPLHVLQALTLNKMRSTGALYCERKEGTEKDAVMKDLVERNPGTEFAPGLEDTLIITMKGIAAGSQNTG
ncbi:hypothetical protein CBR_g15996 [Chara braunii]|uniref:phosphoenolpyruvate carboxylase n=1 Tax=Chara braunii TaxID=69332 RepID=A0A388JSW2_CHABU|nr:hypothetical protein CBR_g15996 [Chara braunii]|eukprot:GBG60875.1 hypothetical protein CBR_g15996 [Chara braunii]